MKKIRIGIIILIAVFKFYEGFSQNWITSKAIVGSDVEPKYSILDPSNNLIVLGAFKDSLYSPYSYVSYGARDLVLLKLNADYQVQWSTRIGCSSADIAGGLTIDNQNNIYITGNYYNTLKITENDTLINSGNADVFLIKYNSDGIFQWAKRVASSSTLQSSFDLKYNGVDKLIMTGFYKDSIIFGSQTVNTDTLPGNSFISNYIATFDLSGNYIWAKTFLGTNDNTRIRRVDLSQNGYYFGGYFQGDLYFNIDTISSYTTNSFDAFLFKTDFNGNVQWIRRIRGQSTENFKTLATDEFDNVYILGNYNSPTIFVDSTAASTVTFAGNTGGYDTYIGKYNRSGVLQWFLCKGSSAKDIYNDFVVRNNLIYATGYFADQIVFNNDTLKTSSSLNEDAFLAAFNEIGDPIAGISITGTGDYNDAGVTVNMGASSRAYVSGYFRSPRIKIGDSTYYNNHVNKSDLFFAIYQHPFKAVITDERQVSCYGGNDGMLKVTPYFGRAPYIYTWSHNPSLNNAVAENLSARNYSVTITDADSRTASISATVSQPTPLSTSGAITPVTCYNGNDGAIDVTPSGGIAPYSYNWLSPDGSGINPISQDQDNINRGHYILTLKDKNLCQRIDTFFVTEPAPFTFGNSTIDSIKIPPGNNGAITLVVEGGTSPYTYNWNGPGIVNDPSQNLVNLSVGGTYIVSVTDSKSCHGDTSFLVPSDTMLIASISSKTDVDCKGGSTGSATVAISNGSDNYTYAWRNNAGTAYGGNEPILSGVPADKYFVNVTDNVSSKTTETSVIINEPSTGISLLLNPTPLRCYNDNSGVINLTVTGGVLPYSYHWSNGAVTEDLVNIAAANYSVTVTDTKGCIQTGSEQITQPTTLSLNLIPDPVNRIYCFGDLTAQVFANAGGGSC